MDFTPYDKESATWQKLKAHYEARLQVLRMKNDHPLPEEQRNILIGQIQEVKTLLALEVERPVMPAQGFIE